IPTFRAMARNRDSGDNPSESPVPRVYSAAEYARALGISKATLFDYEREGKLPAAKRRRRGEVAHRFYTIDDLVAARVQLGLPPRLRVSRRQLFLNFKGGVGKTVIAANYAYRVARYGLSVLAIDLDAQGHLTKCLGIEPDRQERTLLDVLRDRASIEDVVIRGVSGLPNLDLIAANLSLSPIEIILSQKNAREFQLKRALDGQVGRYDVVVLDAPPSLSLLNLNAILSIDDLIIPVLTDYLSYDGLRILFENLATIKDDFGFEPERIGILINAYNAAESLSQQSKAAIEQFYGDLVLDTVIRKNTAIGLSTAEQRSVFEVAPHSKAAKDIEQLVGELLDI